MSRKERRKSEQKQVISSQMKKNTTAFSSALIVSTIATPAILPVVTEATSNNELNTAQVSQLSETQVTTETSSDSVASSTPAEATTNSETTAPQTSAETNHNTTEATTESTTPAPATSTTDPVTSPTPTTTDSIGPAVAPKALGASARSVNPASFIAEIAAYARSVAADNDLYASVMMAQAIVESGWGGSTLSQAPNYNLFGIKGSYQGQTVYMDTWEYLNGQWVIKKEPFRKYPSYQESFQDNAYVLRTTSFQAGVYFYSGTWKSNTNSYKDATAWLTGRYATDPSYGTKLNNVISAYNLTQYDTPATNGNTGGNNNNNTGGGTPTSDVYHTVQAGDSLWALASKYNTTIANIKSWNNLSGDTIYVGQKLIVKKGSAGGTSGSSTNNGTSTGGNNSGGSGSTGNTYYTVKSGDTLSAIAFRHGISLADLRAWNNISGDLIYPGQKFIVKKGSAGGTSGGSTNNGTSTGGNNSGSSGSTGNAYYTVKSGDTLSAIAFRHAISLADLRAWNNATGDLIFPGQKLIVKKGTSAGNSTQNTNTNTNTSTKKTHTVQSGDTLWGLARQYNTSIQKIKQLNGLSGDTIYIGQVLKLA